MLIKQLLRPHRQIIRNAPKFVRHECSGPGRFADGGTHCTMNDLPIPEGDWNEYMSKKNLIGNLVLGSSIAGLIGSIMFYKSCVQDGVITLNHTIPEMN